MPGKPFEQSYTAGPEQIDELGHVNNAEWLRWLQDLSVAHWNAVADPDDIARYFWVVTRHEIDYRANVSLGETVTGRTWIETPPRGARFDRHFAFIAANGKTVVEGKSTWAMVDRESGRIGRVPRRLAEMFLAE